MVKTSIITKTDSLPISLLGAYGSLAFPLAAAFIALQVMVPTHYAESTNLSLTTIGLVLLLARSADLITDPLIGLLSDQTPQHWGKRKIWVIVAAPLLCLATAKLFSPETDVGWGYLLLWSVAIYAAGTMIVVPMHAWGAELSSNYHQRSRISSAKAACGLLGTMIALALPALLVPSGHLGESLKLIEQLVIVSVIVCVMLAWRLVPDNSTVKLPQHTVQATWQLLTRPAPFRQLVVSFLFNSIANAIPATLFLFYLEHVLHAPTASAALLFLYFICSALSIPIWLHCAKRWGKHQTWSWALGIACLFFLWTPFLGEGDLRWYLLIVAVTGFFIGADLVLPNAIMGDLIEWDALQSGLRRPGVFFAIWGTTGKIAFAMAVGITFPLLEIMGFDAQGNNTEQAVYAVALLYGIPSVVLKLTAIFLMRDYPLTEERHQEIQAELVRLEKE